MALCPALPPVSNTLDMGGLVRLVVNTANQYDDCRARHESLAKWAVRNQ